MPAFLDFDHFYNLSEPELWVAIGLILFFAIVIVAKVPALVAGALDAKAAKIQSELDEAARLRAAAEALLAQIRQEKAEAEAQAAEMLKAAEIDARRLEAESKIKLEEALARRQALAERRIAQAEAQASAEVKAAAADLAAKAAEQILTARLAGQATDPLLEGAIAQLGTRLN
jgi:F-type H+-transporting ATPase subunit b